MNDLEKMIETAEAKPAAGVVAASKASWAGVVVVSLILAIVLWGKVRR